MTRELFFGVALGLALAGCATAPAEPAKKWYHIDGRSAVNDPALRQQGEADLAVCRGETTRAALGAPLPNTGSPFGDYFVARNRQGAYDVIFTGCMAGRGWELR